MDGHAARPMVAGGRRGVLGHRLQASGRHQAGEVGGVVDDPVRAAQLAVLVADGIEAVRAGGHDRALAHAIAVERLDVAHREHLEDVVVAHPAGRVARARFLLAQDREGDTGCMKAGRHSSCHLLVARIERRRAADPIEHVELVEPTVGRHLRHGRDLEQGSQRNLNPQGLPDPRNNLRCQKRVTTQAEKVVVDANLFESKDLSPDRDHLSFG